MKLPLTASLRVTLCAVALSGGALAHAQTQPAPMPEPAPAMKSYPAGEMPKHHPKVMPKHKGHHPAGHGKYATPQHHEAAAVAGERSRGAGPHNPGAGQPNEFERNALRRCEIFKTDLDRQACVERVRQPQISGSVQGGGVLREYTQTYQVPAPASPATPAAPAAPAVMPQTHHNMMHPPMPPVEPMGK